MRAKPAIPRLPTRHRRVGGARPGLLGADASSWVARGWVNEYGDEYEDIDEDDDLDVRRRGGPRVGRTGVPPRRGARPPPPGMPRAQPPRQRASSSDEARRDDDDDDEGSRVVMETVQCRSEQEIGRVIGRGGSTVERIQAETGTKIQVDSRTLCVDIKGYPSDVREAVRIVTLVTQEGFGGSVERVPCTGSEGAVIGPKGARIRAIAKETRARLEVQVSDDGDGSSECVIRGSPPEVAAAAAWVRELVAMDRDDRDAAARRGGNDRGGWHKPYYDDDGYNEYADLESPAWDEGRGRGGVRDWDSYTRPMRNPPLPFGYDESGERTTRDGRVKRRESSTTSGAGGGRRGRGGGRGGGRGARGAGRARGREG